MGQAFQTVEEGSQKLAEVEGQLASSEAHCAALCDEHAAKEAGLKQVRLKLGPSFNLVLHFDMNFEWVPVILLWETRRILVYGCLCGRVEMGPHHWP